MKLKKLLAAALAAALTLAGCGTTVLSAEETKELLALSQKTMATVESMAAEMTMEMDMSMGEETAETTTVAKILTQQNPLRMQMNLSATLEDGTEAQNMQMYAEEEDGKLRTYVLAADTWYSQTMELGSLAQYNAEENVTLYLSNLADFSATATEKINDIEATKVEGTLKKDVLQKVLAESGMTETAAAMGVTEEQLAALHRIVAPGSGLFKVTDEHDIHAHGIGLQIIQANERTVLIIRHIIDGLHITDRLSLFNLTFFKVRFHLRRTDLIEMNTIRHLLYRQRLSDDMGKTNGRVVHED